MLVEVVDVLDHPPLERAAHADVVDDREVLDELAQSHAARVRTDGDAELGRHEEHGNDLVHAAEPARVDLADGDRLGLQELLEHDPVVDVLAGGDAATRFAFERCVADLESGTQGYAFASGLAAISTMLELLDAGAHVIATDDLYGGSFRLFDKVRKRTAGAGFQFRRPRRHRRASRRRSRPKTRLIWVETPTNPLLRLADLEAIAALCKKRGIIAAADNTFASPYVQRPLELGFDIVDALDDQVPQRPLRHRRRHRWWSATTPSSRDQLTFLQNAIGAVASPFDSFLALRGMKTLALRMERHCENALEIARWLEAPAGRAQVRLPGSRSHPQHALAKRQMHGFGGMITAILDRDLAGTRRMLERTRLFTLAESLGGVESLIEHPAIMTHASIPAETRARIGIVDGADPAVGGRRGRRRPDRPSALRAGRLRPCCRS